MHHATLSAYNQHHAEPKTDNGLIMGKQPVQVCKPCTV